MSNEMWIDSLTCGQRVEYLDEDKVLLVALDGTTQATKPNGIQNRDML